MRFRLLIGLFLFFATAGAGFADACIAGGDCPGFYPTPWWVDLWNEIIDIWPYLLAWVALSLVVLIGSVALMRVLDKKWDTEKTERIRKATRWILVVLAVLFAAVTAAALLLSVPCTEYVRKTQYVLRRGAEAAPLVFRFCDSAIQAPQVYLGTLLYWVLAIPSWIGAAGVVLWRRAKGEGRRKLGRRMIGFFGALILSWVTFVALIIVIDSIL